MFTLTPSPAIKPISTELASFVNMVNALSASGQLDILSSLYNVPADVPVKEDKPVKRTRNVKPPVKDDTPAWHYKPSSVTQRVRIIAAELAILDAYGIGQGIGNDDILTETSDPAKLGEMNGITASLRYEDLTPYLEAVEGIDIRKGSPYWVEATDLYKSGEVASV